MNKFDECYVISREIITKYIELILLPIYTISNNMKQDKLNEIKTLVNEEYKIIHSMSSVDVKLCLEKVNDNDNNYDSAALTRLRNKLEDYQEVLNGNYITTSELGIKNIPQDKAYSSYEIILSMFNIEVMKRMKDKIYSLTPTCDKDIKFTNNLKKQLEASRINFLFNESTSELISLYNNVDIDQIPRIDIKNLKNKKIRNNSLNNIITGTSAVYVKKILDILSSMPKPDNNPSDMFDYLTLITRLEVLISYLDKNSLKMIYNYCNCIINKENKIKMILVRKLIKDQIEDK